MMYPFRHRMLRITRLSALVGMAALSMGLIASRSDATYVNWENPPLHPVDMSPDGTRLAVTNLPDGRVEIFSLESGSPVPFDSIPVGVDPVTVRFRTNEEAWVVNHISDSISVVDIVEGRVTGTIQTLDEPYDVVFANGKAFVSCSQANAVQVFNLSSPWGLINTIEIDGEDPRAMAVSADGARVFVAIFESGNHSTIIGGGSDGGSGIAFPPDVVEDPLGPYGGANPPSNTGTPGVFSPPLGPAGIGPEVGLIVKKVGNQWLDDNGSDWTSLVSGANAANSGRLPGWDLGDHDLAIINTTSYAVTYATGLMNICMALAVNPANGFVSVVGTDGTNEIRFEPVLSGKFTRVLGSTVDPATTLNQGTADLNAGHLNYSTSTIIQSERNKSLGDPRGLAWNAAGNRAYITGMGSNNLVIVDAAGQRAGAGIVNLGEGPTGLVVDTARNQIYVLNRFESSISVVSTVTETEITGPGTRVPLHDATVSAIRIGRKHLYDTHKTSGLGQIACASCHVDGRMDRLAWDLGDPSGTVKSLAGTNQGANIPGLTGGFTPFHPMKGPMTTQTFQDIIGHEPFHWRGDRLGLEEFNPAFVGLQGDDTQLTPTEMQEYEDMLATIAFPPNPFRNFDNTLSTNLPLPGHFTTGRHSAPGQPLPNGDAANGLLLYRGDTTGNPNTRRKLDSGNFTCVICHTLPTGMGTDYTLSGVTFVQIPPNPPNHPTAPGARHIAMVSVDQSSQRAIKTPQIRNAYEKTGFNTTLSTPNRAGFGVLHDGSVDSLERFIDEPVFQINNDQELANLVAFVLSISGSDLPQGNTGINLGGGFAEPPGPPSQDTHAAVGKQVTVTDATPISLFGQADIVDSMKNLADLPGGRVDLVAHGTKDGIRRGWYWVFASDLFQSDMEGETITMAALEALASPTNPITFTVVPRGVGPRVGTDRDGDGFGDQREALVGSDSADAASLPLTEEVHVAGGPFDFGIKIVEQGATASQDALVMSLGTGTLNFTGAGIEIAGPDAADFSFVSAPSTAPMASLSNQTVSILFDPSSPGAKNAVLRVTTGDISDPTYDVPLSGIAFNFNGTRNWNLYQ